MSRWRKPQPLSHYLKADAARLLGVTKQAIHNRIERGTCPCEVHLGREWVPAWWVERELRKQKRGAK